MTLPSYSHYLIKCYEYFEQEKNLYYKKKHFIGIVDQHGLTKSDPDSILDPDQGFNL